MDAVAPAGSGVAGRSAFGSARLELLQWRSDSFALASVSDFPGTQVLSLSNQVKELDECSVKTATDRGFHLLGYHLCRDPLPIFGHRRS